MIEYRKGDILAADAEALVNTVNCVGVMGRGVALQFKEAFPENFRAYAAACKRGEVRPGRIFVFETGRLTPPRYIVNFPTKRHWRGRSRMEDIEAGLEDLVRQIRQAPRDALIALMQRYLGGALDPFVTLLELHKLMYFMQEAGQPLRLRFAKGHYGPYAENLRHVLREIEGTFIEGYRGEEDAPGMPLTIVPGAVEKADAVVARASGLRERLDRVADLVTGFETPSGLELLATVHDLARKEGIRDEDALIRAVHAWGRRKRAFTPDQIRLASNVLERKGWLPATGEAQSTIPEPRP